MCHSCIALMVYGTKILIQESEQPKRDAVTVSDFGIINGKVAIREIGDLVKGASAKIYGCNHKFLCFFTVST